MGFIQEATEGSFKREVIWCDLHLEHNLSYFVDRLGGGSVGEWRLEAVWNKGMEKGDAANQKEERERGTCFTSNYWGIRFPFTLPRRWVGTPGVTVHLVSLPPQGKFIRIHFGTTGKLASADIETCK